MYAVILCNLVFVDVNNLPVVVVIDISVDCSFNLLTLNKLTLVQATPNCIMNLIEKYGIQNFKYIENHQIALRHNAKA